VDNPLTSEEAAFRLLIRFVLAAAAIVAIVVIVQALT
jgi:hypothetical protein